MKMTIERLNEIKAQYEPIVKARNFVIDKAAEMAEYSQYRKQILVCGVTGCTSSGCGKVVDALEAELKANNCDDVIVVKTGCFGYCALGPIVIVYPEGAFYSQATPEGAKRIVNEHIVGGNVCKDLLFPETVQEDGEVLPFRRKKAKELLAVLVDRNGAGMTAKQICAILFPDDTDDSKNAAYLRQLVLDLKNTLKTIRAEDVLRHETPYYRIDTNLVRCDYISFLETGKPRFYGEYMTQYSWAEETCAMLQSNR